MYYCCYNVEDLKTKSIWPAVILFPIIGLEKIEELMPSCLLKLNKNEVHVLPIKTLFSFYSCFDLQAALQKRYRFIIDYKEYTGGLCSLCLNKIDKIIGQCNTYNFELAYWGRYDLKLLIEFLREQNYQEIKAEHCFKSSYLKQCSAQNKNNVYHPNMLSIETAKV